MKIKIHEINGYIQTIFLVQEDENFLLLDGCSRPDVEIIFSYMEKQLSKKISDLKLVITTHPHPDHAGGVSYFREKGIQVAGPEKINLWYRGFSGLFTYWTDILLTYLVAISKKSGFKNIFFPRNIKIDLVLKEGMEIPGFENWTVLECPGHTSMDLTIYNTGDNIAYIADNFVGSSKRIFRPYPLTEPENYKKSLQRYIELGIQEFLIAHYGRVKVEPEKIKKLIETTPRAPRRHLNTLPAIFAKIGKSIFKKL